MQNSLEGKVAVITGGAQGVGLGIAQEFVTQGARVVITGRRQPQLDEAVAVLGPTSSAIVADVANLTAMEAMYKEVMVRHGRLDVVVANAGVGDQSSLGSITEQQFDHIYDIDVKGILFTVQPALPLLPKDGTIVIIGSTGSIQARPGMSLYCGAKAAIRQIVRGWIQEIKGSGVRINVLSPGAIDTPSLRTALERASGADKVEALVKSMGEGNPLGRLGDAREIGKAAVFLASEASSFITGVELFADGGMAQTG